MIVNPARSLRRKALSYIFVGACAFATLIAVFTLGLILFSLLKEGFSGVNMNVFTLDTPGPGGQGGLRNAIIGSVMMCASAMLFSLIVGILAGTWLAEIGGDTRYGHVVRFLNDVLLSAPSILVGLFVYGILVKPFGGFSGIAGAAALAMIATPVVTRTTEDILNLQSNALREAGMAMGASQWVTVKDIIWKAAGAGLLTGGLLGFARISGETAPLLFTALGNPFFNADMRQPMSSLPTVINQFALSPYEDWQALAWTGALIVSSAVLAINIIGRWIAAKTSQR
jgi:phosphate transport system permease protein